MNYYTVCSNPECDYAEPYAVSAELLSALERPSEAVHFRNAIALAAKPVACGRCGSSMLIYCAHCGKGPFTSPGVRHCGACGLDIKVLPCPGRRKTNKPINWPERRSGQDRRLGPRPEPPEKPGH